MRRVLIQHRGDPGPVLKEAQLPVRQRGCCEGFGKHMAGLRALQDADCWLAPDPTCPAPCHQGMCVMSAVAPSNAQTL